MAGGGKTVEWKGRHKILARLQQLTTVCGVALSLLWLLAVWRIGHPAVALAGAMALVGCYAIVLGIEFVLLKKAHGFDLTPRATGGQLFRAWVHEVCAAPVVFCWRQPFRSQRWPNQLPPDARGRRGVLLVHGFVCNRGVWNSWLRRLSAQGTPLVAVSLEPVFGAIDGYCQRIEHAVCQLERCTGLSPIIVAHSMGGLAVRSWWANHNVSGRVHRAITIGTPHQGTWLARFAMTTNARQMRRSSEWLSRLAASEPADRAASFTCFYSNCDNIVFPPSAASLPGADNRLLPGVAHVQMVDRPEPWNELQRCLHQPGNVAPTA